MLSAMKGAPSIGGSAQAVSNANAAQDAASLTSSAAQAKQIELNNKKLSAEIDLLKSQSYKARAEARNTGNIGNVTENLGNLSSGFHGLTESTSKAVSDSAAKIIRDKDKIISKLKKAPADFWWAAKQGAKKLQFWKRK